MSELSEEYGYLAVVEERLRIVVEALEGLHAEVKVNLLPVAEAIRKGLEQGIPTVQHSLPHGRLDFSIPRVERELLLAEKALARVRSQF